MGSSRSGMAFIHWLVAREHFPGWRKMWDDFIREEIWRSAKGVSKSDGGGEEENVALSSKGKKGKNIKKGSSSGARQDKGEKKEKKKDMRKVK